MIDYSDVQKYQLTENQKNRILKLMKEFGFENVEAFVDLMIGHEYYGLDRIRREAAGVRKWKLAY
jgi:spore cortex formation protein SpoVR/YcgB (stage V sporulation)